MNRIDVVVESSNVEESNGLLLNFSLHTTGRRRNRLSLSHNSVPSEPRHGVRGLPNKPVFALVSFTQKGFQKEVNKLS